MAQGKTVVIAVDRSKNAEHAFECKFDALKLGYLNDYLVSLF